VKATFERSPVDGKYNLDGMRCVGSEGELEACWGDGLADEQAEKPARVTGRC
jgi:hypothetical protein